VAISERTAAYLVSFLEWKQNAGEPTDPESPVFVSQRWCSMTPSGVSRGWKAALARAGLPAHWGVHATRHSYAVEV